MRRPQNDGLPSFLSSDGFPSSATSSAFGNSFRFHGMECDAELGIYYYAKHKAQMTEIQSNPLNTDRLTRGHNPFYEAGFASAGGMQYFDPQIASAICSVADSGTFATL